MFVICDNKNQDKIRNYFLSRFGIEKIFFEKYLFYKKNKSLFIITKEKEEQINKIISKNQIRSMGIELFCNLKETIPSSIGISAIFKADQIKTNYLMLDRKQAIDFFENKEININDILKKQVLSSGYVIAILNQKIIGTLYFDKEKKICKPNISFENNNIK